MDLLFRQVGVDEIFSANEVSLAQFDQRSRIVDICFFFYFFAKSTITITADLMSANFFLSFFREFAYVRKIRGTAR